ncbi:TP53-binding protein 1-like [Pomacea canaliculata]|nr:TP53-binding protein 1-like [Pomacea canaliculata]
MSSVTELAAGGSISVQTCTGGLHLLNSSRLLSRSMMLPSESAGPTVVVSQMVPGQQSTSTVKSHCSVGLEVRSALSELQDIASSVQNQGKIGGTRSVEFTESVVASSPQKQPSIESQSSDSVIEETIVKEVVMQYKHRTITVRHCSLDGTILHEKVTEEKEDPVIMEENTLSKKRRITNPHSPSRSGGTLTSGDLADISSSSLSNRVGPSSLESNLSSLELPPQANSAALSAQEALQLQRSSAERMLAPVTASSDQTNCATYPVQTAVQRVSAAFSPDGLSPDQSTIERDESHVEAMVTSSSSGQASEPLYSADNMPQSETKQERTPTAQPSLLRSSSSSTDTPSVKGPKGSKGLEKQLKTVSHTRSRSAKRVAADSSQSEGKHDARSSSSLVSRDVQDASGGFIVLPSVSSRKSSGQMSDFMGTNVTLQPASEKEKMVGGSVGAGDSTSSSNDQLSVQVPLQMAISDDDATHVVVQIASKLARGAKIMARWKDGFFYPATFNGLNTSIGNKFRVKFEDGIEKTVRGVDMILAQHLPIGQSVLVASEDNAGDAKTYDPGIIIEHIIEDNDVFYTVAMDDGSNRRCSRSSLLLTEDQASCLLSDEEMRVTFGEDMRHLNTADVSLDNILCGRRLRTKDAPALPPDPSNRPSTSISLSRSRTDKARKYICATPARPKQEEGEGNDAAEKESSLLTSTEKSSTRKRKVGPMATSTPTPKHHRLLSKEEAGKSSTLSVSPVGGAVVSPQTLPSSESCAGLFEKNQGPLPTKNIFLGMMFLLTHTDKYPETVAQEMSWLKQDLSADTSACDSNEDTAEGCTFPFDKHHLQRQIEAGSGVVLDRLNPSQVSSGKKKLFLISDTYQRTVKYLQCLAAGVPIVSHQWVIDSCKQDKLLDYKAYLLPAGISFEKRKIVERNSSANCLISHRILLTSSKPDFLEVWNSVLELSRCKILSNFPPTASKYRPCVDVVVTDETCIPSILKKAKQFGVPVVGSEWVIQCLINNQVMNHIAHERYAHDLYKNEKRT